MIASYCRSNCGVCQSFISYLWQRPWWSWSRGWHSFQGNETSYLLSNFSYIEVFSLIMLWDSRFQNHFRQPGWAPLRDNHQDSSKSCLYNELDSSLSHSVNRSMWLVVSGSCLSYLWYMQIKTFGTSQIKKTSCDIVKLGDNTKECRTLKLTALVIVIFWLFNQLTTPSIRNLTDFADVLEIDILIPIGILCC